MNNFKVKFKQKLNLTNLTTIELLNSYKMFEIIIIDNNFNKLFNKYINILQILLFKSANNSQQFFVINFVVALCKQYNFKYINY